MLFENIEVFCKLKYIVTQLYSIPPLKKNIQ